MFFRQLFEEGLAQASYIIGCPDSEEALVVDPRRDVDIYLAIAEQNDLRITGVTETHIHADFLSGARELAAAAGATLCLSAEGGNGWQYRGLEAFRSRMLRDNDIIRVGTVNVRVKHTPGHTPEHLMFIISERSNDDVAMMALTGDFVFAGDLGRPDLLESAVGVVGSAAAGAATLFESVRSAFLPLPEYVSVWPAHGAGSACGKALAAVPASTVGFERRTAWWAPYVDRNDRSGFIERILEGQPDAPPYFARMKRLNRDGVPMLDHLPVPEEITPSGLEAALGEGAQLVDTRSKEAHRTEHLSAAISIPGESSFATRAGWFVSPEKPIVLIAERNRIEGLVRALIRVGLDRVIGFVPAEALASYRSLGLASNEPVDVAEAHRQWERGAAVLDVRSTAEYRQGHIPGAIHVPAQRLLLSLENVPRDRPLFVHCAGGGRSNVASSVLRNVGFHDVADVEGGFSAWEAAGYAVESEEPIAAP